MSGQSYARRAVLRGAAGAGALGLAAAAGAGTVVAASASAAQPEQEQALAAVGTAVVVYVRDASSGLLEIFAGTSRTEVHDPAVAARLARAISGR